MSIGTRVCQGPNVVKGIDVSRWEPIVDYKQVAGAGEKFVFAKASEGLTSHDSTFAIHRKNAKAAGLIVGAYHFFHPKMDGVTQAENILKTTGGVLPGELPITLDVEWADGLESLQGHAMNTLACLQHIEKATGLPPIIYTGAPFFQFTDADPKLFAHYPLWIAAYAVDCPKIPAPYTNWAFWQHTDHAPIPGAGKIDANLFNGTLDDLKALTKK